MKIVHIAAELSPPAKVGGLGDVLHGLCRALLAKKHSVEIILPKYDILDLNQVQNLEILDKNFEVLFGDISYENTIWRGKVDSIPVFLIEPNYPCSFFNRKTIYGCEDDPLRFAYFSHAALDFLSKSSSPPDIIHIHDWHTALIAPLLKNIYSDRLNASVVLTIHNLAYQGHSGKEILDHVGLKKNVAEKLQEAPHSKTYNLLKGGIFFADHVTTVSPNYAKELLETSLGGKLTPLLQKRKKTFSGVLNGIDFGYWDPTNDPCLPTHYSRKDFSKGKARLKKHLRERLSLSDEERPLVSAITRLVYQKGTDLIKAGILRTLENGGQFVLLGSALDEKTLETFQNLKKNYANSSHIHLELTFNEELSHLVFAASDLFLVPSLFEPCGLTQMIAMHYGTVPLVRKTGGLADTVFEGQNGFLFGPPTSEAIGEAIERALTLWREEPETWKQLIESGMSEDFSWEKPSEAYLAIYKSLTKICNNSV